MSKVIVIKIKKILTKIKNILIVCPKRLLAIVFGTEIPDKKFLKKILNCKIKDTRGFMSYFSKRKKPLFFIGFKRPEEIIFKKIIGQAEKFCQHWFDLLGSGKKDLGVKINWHCDFKTGFCWNPKTYYKSIKIPYGEADIKVPWELSRFQHLVLLGQAYKLTNDEKYAQEFVVQVSDWIDNNKPEFGVNWACTMEVAVRASNWIMGWEFFEDLEEISPEFLIKFLRSLYQHGQHVMDNLEYSETLTSNHYLSDVVGLVFIGTMFPEFKESEKWQKFAVKELIKEMKKQVYSDGVDFEGSTCYHRLVLELFFYVTFLEVVNDAGFTGENYSETSEKIFGKEYTVKLYRMFDAVCYLIKPNGRMPQIGDNDSGQFIKLYPREVLDMRYLLALGAVFFKERRWKISEFFQTEEDIAEVYILFGKTGEKIWDSLEWNFLKNIKSKSFSDAGWYVMRDHLNYCLVSCGPNGQKGNGGHSHNDKLSFELCLDGEDVIVDPGSYLYTSDLASREAFRQTAAHNSVKIDEAEQNRLDEQRPFFLKNDARTKIIDWKIMEDKDVFEGEHYGYYRLTSPVCHRRRLEFYKKEPHLEISDFFITAGEHTYEWNFILSPQMDGSLQIFSKSLEFIKNDFFYSPEYGVKINSRKIFSRLTESGGDIEIDITIKK
jgi:hypothetical protein